MLEKDKDLSIINFTYDLPSINKIVRQPSQLKIDYELLAKLCSIGCSMTECAFAIGTTTQVLDLRIRQQKKMTFHEFQGFYESFQSISIRRKLLKKAIIDEHFPSLQWLSINQLGMSKDGMMKKDDGEENNSHSTQELVDVVRRSLHAGTKEQKKNNEQRASPIASRPISGESGTTNTRVHNDSKHGSGSARQGNGNREETKTGGEGCVKTNPNQIAKVKLQSKINNNSKTREKIQTAKRNALEKINSMKVTTSTKKKTDG